MIDVRISTGLTLCWFGCLAAGGLAAETVSIVDGSGRTTTNAVLREWSADRVIVQGEAVVETSLDDLLSVSFGRQPVPLVGGDPGVQEVSVSVDLAWQRRGIGSRLLTDIARLAARQGATDIVFTTRADNQAVLPLILASGLRSRIRMTSDRLTVRVPVAEPSPAR